MNSIGSIGRAYYTAFGKRNFKEMEKYLHRDAQLVSPLATVNGKEAVLESSKNFAAFFTELQVRQVLVDDTHAAVVYDLKFPAPIGALSSTVLIGFKEGLITKLELFYDSRPFVQKKDEIFKG